MAKTVLVSGSQGFVGGYLCRELLSHGYKVIGIDNYSKYGPVKRDYDDHENFRLVVQDISKIDLGLLRDITKDCDYIVACAAMIGGISYFHKYPYDLLAHNERIAANTFDVAIKNFQRDKLKRIVVISSSMVYEGADVHSRNYEDDYGCTYWDDWGEHKVWPTEEGAEKAFPPPYSTYGFQKLAMEYYAKGACEQYGLPYTIIRPFNCVGVGEEDALGEEEVLSGNVKLMMSHVLPDLINKTLQGQDPLHILGAGNQIRCYTHGSDIARGIRMAMESPDAEGEAFNISTERATTVLDLAQLVWSEIHGKDRPFNYTCDKPYEYDVQKRIPDVKKAWDILGWKVEMSLEDSIKEVVKEMRGL